MLKLSFKHLLARLGLFSYLDFLRRLPDISRWLNRGCRGAAPHPVKRLVIAEYLRSFGVSQFVETGTHLGDTLAAVASNRAVLAISIELDEKYFLAAKRRFSDYPNVTLLQGDSGLLMPRVVAKLQGPALFWLDGHYSGAETAKAEFETPVTAELDAILNSTIAGHVILIDDARCFDGTHDYPHVDELLAKIRGTGKYQVEICADIFRVTPVVKGC